MIVTTKSLEEMKDKLKLKNFGDRFEFKNNCDIYGKCINKTFLGQVRYDGPYFGGQLILEIKNGDGLSSFPLLAVKRIEQPTKKDLQYPELRKFMFYQTLEELLK